MKKDGRPSRYQLQWYAKNFAGNFPHTPNARGIRFIERLTTHFLFDSRYSRQLSHNFRTILRSIGLTIAGDGKLLHFTGIVTYISIISVRNTYNIHRQQSKCLKKPDRVGLWVYELCVRLSDQLPFTLDIRLHDAISLLGETIPVNKVVTLWVKIVHSFHVACMSDTVLVFHSYKTRQHAKDCVQRR